MMSLNIKGPEAHELARQLAGETGETITAAVTEALRERLERVRQQRRKQAIADRLMEIGRRGAFLFPGTAVDHAEFLYDENGLPK